jgi:hypothetical protein
LITTEKKSKIEKITFNHNHTIFSKKLTNLEGIVDGKDEDDDEEDSLKENKRKVQRHEKRKSNCPQNIPVS